MVTEKMIEALKPCQNCGGKERSWFPANKINTTAQDGRLKSNEISCDFVLGCDECSETLRVVSADEIASRMTSALSTDAEPVGYATEYGIGYLAKRSGSFNLAMTKVPDSLNNIALFTAPPQPAPSGAVKALEWERRESISRYSGMTGYYSILLLDDGQWKFSYGSPGKTATFDVSKHPNRDEAEKAAQYVHNTMIRDALSAQVQDVAVPEGWQLVPKKATREMCKEGERWTPMPEQVWEDMLGAAPISDLEAASAAKLEEKP